MLSLLAQAVVPAQGSSALAAHIIAIAGVVFIVLQGVKKYFPQVSGMYAVVLNLALSVVAVIAAAQPNSLFSMAVGKSLIDILMTTAVASGLAAGAHGTYKSFTEPTS